MSMTLVREQQQPSSSEAGALAAASVMRGLADSRRLLVLCKLHELGSCDVAGLAEATGMPALAVGRLLAGMEVEGMIAGNGDAGRASRYRIADPRVRRLLTTLHAMFCPAPGLRPIRPSAGNPGLWL